MSYQPPSDFQQSGGGQLEEDQQNLEMFLIQVPKKFDIEQLNGVRYTPGQIIDVATDDSLPGQLSAVYQLAASTMQDLDLKPLVKHKKETVVGQSITGHLSVTKSYNVESKPSRYTLPNLERPGPSLVPMPAGLRERFTPFGSGFPTRCHKHSKHRKHHNESTAASNETSEKKKKRKQKRDVDSSVKVEPSVSTSQNSPSSHFMDVADSTGCLSELNESYQKGQRGQSSPERGKHKTKKQKRHKEKRDGGGEADSLSTIPNGSLDLNDSLACDEIKGILSNSVKVKKHKKNVSFSQEDSVFMNNSGDASALYPSSPQEGAKEKKHAHHPELSPDVNGDSEKPEAVKTGKKRKLSSGYSSADTSLEIYSPSLDNSDRPVKRKKKKHKTVDTDS